MSSVTTVMSSVTTEPDVGITQYLNQENPGFSGRLKERFSDFNVIEIDPQGNLVSLIPPPKSAEELAKEALVPRSECEYGRLPPEEQDVISEQDYTQLQTIGKAEDKKPKMDIVVNNLDKISRKILHGIIKRQELKAETITNEANDKIIRVVVSTGPKNQVVGVRGRSKEEKFLHFNLYKENQTTSECISGIARGCGTKDRYFTTAGNKDKRGRTVQRVAVSQIKPETVEKSAKKLRGVVAVGNYSYHPQGLRLGDLKGNRFQIVVKDIDIDDAKICPIMDHFSEHGFINYFGMQRFGTSNISTHKIGLAILRKDFDAAIDLILAPRENQFTDLRSTLLKYAADQDAKAAFNSLSYRFKNSIEGKLLYGLQSCHSNDKINALKKVPVGIRQMYGHAYQSYIWNNVVSRRIQDHGMQVLEGDLVEDKDNITHRLNVKHLEKPELHTIHDVYIPLPGYEAKLPNNKTTEYMMDLLKVDGLDLQSFRNLTREYDLPGDYRAMLTKASDVSWRTVQYSSNEDDLVHSQLEIVARHDAPDQPMRKLGDEAGSLRALVVEISLSSSCYATMALREIMRVKTDLRSMKNQEPEEEEEIENPEDLVAEENQDGAENGDNKMDDLKRTIELVGETEPAEKKSKQM